MESARIAHNLGSEQRTNDVAAGSIKTFDELELRHKVLRALKHHNFLIPTKIQAAAIPMALMGMDLLVQSKSGTGKTLIFVAAALHNFDKHNSKPQALVIAPTREIAIQIEDIFNGIGSAMMEYFFAVSCIGGTNVSYDRKRLSKGRLVVGTPGRLVHLMQNNVFDTKEIKMLVLDEADQLYATPTMLHDVNEIIKMLPQQLQIIACSATYEDNLDQRLSKLMRSPLLISNSERATVLLGVRQFVLELPETKNSMQEMQAKLAALIGLFGQLSYEQAIIFASSQMRADSYCNHLKNSGVDCVLMSGALNQSERMDTFKGYRSFTVRTVVATDLMARGVDSAHANLVVNMDMPKDRVTYFHRIGRAGRFGSQGIAVTMICSSKQLQKFKQWVAEAGTGMSVMYFPKEQQEKLDFWNFKSYELPYLVKSVSQEQDDSTLKSIISRIKPKTQPTADTKPANVVTNGMTAGQPIMEAAHTSHFGSDVNLNEAAAAAAKQPKKEVLKELASSAENIIQTLNTADKSKTIDSYAENPIVEDKENVMQIGSSQEKSLQQCSLIIHNSNINNNTNINIKETSCNIVAANTFEEIKDALDEQIIVPTNKQQELAKQILARNDEVADLQQFSKECKLLDTKDSTGPTQQELANKILASSDEVENLEHFSKACKLLDMKDSAGPTQQHSEIDTKTYCLAVPTERSSTTLQPLAISNTVDDASSIISDSMENGYASDESYKSFYTDGDEQEIWKRYKVQEAHKKFANKRVHIYNWRYAGWLRNRSLPKRASKSIKNPNMDDDDEDGNDLDSLPSAEKLVYEANLAEENKLAEFSKKYENQAQDVFDVLFCDLNMASFASFSKNLPERKYIYSGADGLTDLVESEYLKIISQADVKCSISSSGYAYYAAVLTWARMLYVDSQNGGSITSSERNFVAHSLKFKPPKLLASYLSSIGDTKYPCAFHTLRFRLSKPAYVSSSLRGKLPGYFGPMCTNAQYYASYPCLAVYAQRIMQDLAATARSKKNELWNLPSDLAFAGHGLTQACLGYAPAQLLHRGQAAVYNLCGITKKQFNCSADQLCLNLQLMKMVQSWINDMPAVQVCDFPTAQIGSQGQLIKVRAMNVHNRVQDTTWQAFSCLRLESSIAHAGSTFKYRVDKNHSGVDAKALTKMLCPFAVNNDDELPTDLNFLRELESDKMLAAENGCSPLFQVPQRLNKFLDNIFNSS